MDRQAQEMRKRMNEAKGRIVVGVGFEVVAVGLLAVLPEEAKVVALPFGMAGMGFIMMGGLKYITAGIGLSQDEVTPNAPPSEPVGPQETQLSTQLPEVVDRPLPVESTEREQKPKREEPSLLQGNISSSATLDEVAAKERRERERQSREERKRIQRLLKEQSRRKKK